MEHRYDASEPLDVVIFVLELFVPGHDIIQDYSKHYHPTALLTITVYDWLIIITILCRSHKIIIFMCC